MVIQKGEPPPQSMPESNAEEEQEPPAEEEPEGDAAEEEGPEQEPEPSKEESPAQKSDNPPERKNPAALLEYLENLTRFLPEEKKAEFDQSEMRLKIETLRNRMSGKLPLTRKIEKDFNPPQAPVPVTNSRIVSAFSFLENLSSHLPDRGLGLALGKKIHHIVEGIRSTRNGE